jgi:hypothetical protein
VRIPASSPSTGILMHSVTKTNVECVVLHAAIDQVMCSSTAGASDDHQVRGLTGPGVCSVTFTIKGDVATVDIELTGHSVTAGYDT